MSVEFGVVAKAIERLAPYPFSPLAMSLCGLEEYDLRGSSPAGGLVTTFGTPNSQIKWPRQPIFSAQMGLPHFPCSIGKWRGNILARRSSAPCSTVHAALEGLQTIDLPLGLAVAPTLYQRVCNGVEISPHRSSEALHCVDAGLLRVIEPDVEFLNVFASKNPTESHAQPTHGREIRRRAFQSVDLVRLTRRQQPTRLDA
jgi:hypothetical protein